MTKQEATKIVCRYVAEILAGTTAERVLPFSVIEDRRRLDEAIEKIEKEMARRGAATSAESDGVQLGLPL